MTSIIITPKNSSPIRFNLYETEAPETVKAFLKVLPYNAVFYHAKISGEEIWLKDGPALDIPQENCSVFAEPGEIVIGPLKPARNKICCCMGIFYGDGKLLDGGNIFGKVLAEDLPLLKELGKKIWLQGAMELQFAELLCSS